MTDTEQPAQGEQADEPQETMTVNQLVLKLAEREWRTDKPEATVRILAGRDPFFGVKEAKWIWNSEDGWHLDMFNYALDQRLEAAEARVREPYEQELTALRARLEAAETALRGIIEVPKGDAIHRISLGNMIHKMTAIAAAYFRPQSPGGATGRAEEVTP